MALQRFITGAKILANYYDECRQDAFTMGPTHTAIWLRPTDHPIYPADTNQLFGLGFHQGDRSNKYDPQKMWCFDIGTNGSC